MVEKIILEVILTIVGFIITGTLGYFVAKAKEYKSKLQSKENEEKLLKTALMTMLQSNLTNTYYVYESMKTIPDYVYKNWANSFKIYKALGGNDYVDTIKSKIDKWDFQKTDILK